jgi:hypothetical protein
MCAERSPMNSPTWVSGSTAAIPAMAPEIPSSLQSWGWWHKQNEKLQVFKARAQMTGGNYQTQINQALRDAVHGMTLAEVVRQTIRQELHAG